MSTSSSYEHKLAWVALLNLLEALFYVEHSTSVLISVFLFTEMQLKYCCKCTELVSSITISASYHNLVICHNA